MTLGGLHGRGMVHSSGVGAPMVPRGQVIHHQQRCRAQQRVTTTISQISGEFHLRDLRGGGGERHRGHRCVIYEGDVTGASQRHEIKLYTLCDVPAACNQHRTTVLDVFVPTSTFALVSSFEQKYFSRMFPWRS